MTERINGQLKTYMRKYVDKRQDDWTTWLPRAEYAINQATVGNNQSEGTPGLHEETRGTWKKKLAGLGRENSRELIKENDWVLVRRIGRLMGKGCEELDYKY